MRVACSCSLRGHFSARPTLLRPQVETAVALTEFAQPPLTLASPSKHQASSRMGLGKNPQIGAYWQPHHWHFAPLPRQTTSTTFFLISSAAGMKAFVVGSPPNGAEPSYGRITHPAPRSRFANERCWTDSGCSLPGDGGRVDSSEYRQGATLPHLSPQAAKRRALHRGELDNKLGVGKWRSPGRTVYWGMRFSPEKKELPSSTSADLLIILTASSRHLCLGFVRMRVCLSAETSAVS